MKGDHRKTEGATRFDFEKHIVKVQTGIRAKRRSHGFCKRPGENVEKSKEGYQNLNNPQNPMSTARGLEGINYKEQEI